MIVRINPADFKNGLKNVKRMSGAAYNDNDKTWTIDDSNAQTIANCSGLNLIVVVGPAAPIVPPAPQPAEANPTKTNATDWAALAAARAAADRAADAPLVAAMEAQAEALAQQIPPDCARVRFVKNGSLDGDATGHYEADGTEVSWQDITLVGRASATRPGALAAFAEADVWQISRTRLAEMRGETEQQAADEAQAKGSGARVRAAAFADARATGQPVYLRSWTEECDDPREECSLDRVSLYALPDGTTEQRRAHTW